jgi:hypothetical protein
VTKLSFSDALSQARIDGAQSFIDPETGTTIGVDRDGNPGRYGLMVRSLRLEDQRKNNVWWRRASRRIGQAWETMMGGAS